MNITPISTQGTALYQHNTKCYLFQGTRCSKELNRTSNLYVSKHNIKKATPKRTKKVI